MARARLNLIAGLVVALAIAWQLVVLWRQYPSKDPRKNTIDSTKLLSDLTSPEAKQRISAMNSVAAMMGIAELRRQLLPAGITRALAEQVLKADMDTVGDDMLPLSLIALAKLVKEQPESADELVELKLLPRLVKIMLRGVPGWVATCAQLLHSMWAAEPHLPALIQQQVVSGREELLVTAAMELLEAGAVRHHMDALVSGMRLLELLLKSGGAAQKQASSDAALRIVTQVFISGHGSPVMGATAAALAAMTDADHQVVPRINELGLVSHIMAEARLMSDFSAASMLALITRLVNNEEAQGDLVATGLLSVCGQLVFNASATDGWRASCLQALSDIASLPMPDNISSPPTQRRHGMACLIQLTQQVSNVAMHNTVFQALRDLGTHKLAAEEMVKQGVLDSIARLLQRRVPHEHPKVQGWLMQTQRTAALLAALLALQPTVRSSLGVGAVIEGLAACVHNNLDGAEALQQQLRVTAAAALVPVLSEHDTKFDRRVVESGVLADLIVMFYRTSDQERQVATRVMSLLARQKEVKLMFERTNLKIPALQATSGQGGVRASGGASGGAV